MKIKLRHEIADQLGYWDIEGCEAIEKAVKIIVPNADDTKISQALWSGVDSIIDFDRNILDWINEDGNYKRGFMKYVVNPFIKNVKEVKKQLI